MEDAYILDFEVLEDPSSPSPATPNSDFIPFTTTVTFPAGSVAGTQILVDIPTEEDTLVEGS